MTGRITRRAAVKSLVAAPCLFTILPSGLARGYSANEKLNIALVGWGRAVAGSWKLSDASVKTWWPCVT